jgi:hypothetical protein
MMILMWKNARIRRGVNSKFDAKVPEYFLVHRRGSVVLVDHTLTLAVMWILWTSSSCSSTSLSCITLQRKPKNMHNNTQLRISHHLGFFSGSRSRKSKDMTVTEMYTVLKLFTLMGMLQKPTKKSY